jgi:hypothetical protein
MVTLKDIFEQLVDKFTTRQPDFGMALSCNDEDMAMMARGQSEETRSHARPGISPGCAAHAQRPDCRALAGQSRGARCGGVALEIVQPRDRKVKMVRLHHTSPE